MTRAIVFLGIGVSLCGCASPQPLPMEVLLISDRNTAAGSRFAERLAGRGEVQIHFAEGLDGLSSSAKADVLLLDRASPIELSRGCEQKILQFARSGKGVVAMGYSLKNARSSPALSSILGGSANDTMPAGKVSFVVLDPADATMLGVGGDLAWVDALPIPNPSIMGDNNVLIRTAWPTVFPGDKIADRPVPVAWTRRVGEGRVFATVLGCEDAVLGDERFITIIHNALRWCGGRMADTRHNVLSVAEQQAGFELLFDGRDLTGWTGDSRLWSVENGEIVGRGEKLPHNVFLIHDKPYSDFVLRYSVRLVNHNSGVQFRSQRFPGFVVKGYQVDIADRWYGSLYEEGLGQGVLADGFAGKGEKVARIDGWNDMVVKAVGTRITIKLNGLTTVDFRETDPSRPRSGVIALQLHAGPPMEVRFRDIRIRPLVEATRE
ncbi:MAG: family 16 glycoside hydrolase [Phycisphaerae bacterium]